MIKVPVLLSRYVSVRRKSPPPATHLETFQGYSLGSHHVAKNQPHVRLDCSCLIFPGNTASVPNQMVVIWSFGHSKRPSRVPNSGRFRPTQADDDLT
jgi:hypothetical protein